MPLKHGKSRKVINSNTRELIQSWQRTGHVGTSRPKTASEAVKQAYTISQSEAKRS